MTETIAAYIWVAGIIAWVAIRYPHRRRAKRLKVVEHRRSTGEKIALGLCIVGLVVVPAVWVFTGFPAFADRAFVPALGWLGILVLVGFLALFHYTHRQLAKNWSVTLELREDHELVTSGVYGWVRHPMYTSFFLWGLAQALLISNWIAGLAGLAAVLWLYASRIGEEEAMMEAHFGDAYRDYGKRTARLVPGIY